MPIKYDPAATCPAIDKFIEEVFPADAIEVAYEVCAYTMTPWRAIQKAILCTGEGANGKSVFLRLLRRFIGKPNTTSTSLHKLAANRFSSARLLGKLANICPDLPSEHLAGTSVFKSLTGGDDLPGEYKFGAEFDFRSFAVLIFSANHPPRSNDASHAFIRRWHVIPFLRTFSPEQAIPDDWLDAMLHAPGELSGLLNRAIEAWAKLRERGRFLEPESCKTAWNEFRSSTDPFAVWLSQFTIDAPDSVIPKGALSAAYTAHCHQHGRPALSSTAFGLALHRERPSVVDKQRTVGGKLQWCYVGIGLLHDESDPSRTSRASRGFPYPMSRTRANGDSEEQQDSENRVNRVNPVSDEPLFEGDRSRKRRV